MSLSVESAPALSNAQAARPAPASLQPPLAPVLVNRKSGTEGAAPQPPPAGLIQAPQGRPPTQGLPPPAGGVALFTNPYFFGLCRVQLAPGETRESVLAYLNNPMSSGKSYCLHTSVRGGWVDVSTTR